MRFDIFDCSIFATFCLLLRLLWLILLCGGVFFGVLIVVLLDADDLVDLSLRLLLLDLKYVCHFFLLSLHDLLDVDSWSLGDFYLFCRISVLDHEHLFDL